MIPWPLGLAVYIQDTKDTLKPKECTRRWVRKKYVLLCNGSQRSGKKSRAFVCVCLCVCVFVCVSVPCLVEEAAVVQRNRPALF